MIICSLARPQRWCARIVLLMVVGAWSAGCAPMKAMKAVEAYHPVDVHPVTYWWHFEPTRRGEWDYFAQIPHPYLPVPVLVH